VSDSSSLFKEITGADSATGFGFGVSCCFGGSSGFSFGGGASIFLLLGFREPVGVEEVVGLIQKFNCLKMKKNTHFLKY
jgi:hypothetical protein